MAKRFTDTNKYDKPWFRKLLCEHKCFFDYMLCRCDMAGIWEVDFESAEFYIGKKIEQKEMLNIFSEQIIILNERKWFIPNFIFFQYGTFNLNSNSPIHKKIIEILNKYTLWDSIHNRVLYTIKEKEEAKEELKKEIKATVAKANNETENHPLQIFASELTNVSSLKIQLSYAECETLCKKYSIEKIKEVLTQMENKADLKRKYVSVFLTCNNWCKNNFSNNNGQTKSPHHLPKGLNYNEAL